MSKNARFENTGNTKHFNYTKWGFILGTSIAIATLIASVTVPEVRCSIGLKSEACVVQTQVVELITQTEQGETLGGVKIQYISQGAPEFQYTDDNGFARVTIPSKGDVNVILSKEGYQKQNFTIDLQNEQSKTKIIRFTKSGVPEIKPLVSSPAAPVTNPSTTTPPTETTSTYRASSTDLSQETSVKSENELSKEFDKLIFNLQDCRQENKVIKCNLLITNKSIKRRFKINPSNSRIIFNDGDENFAYVVQIGKTKGFYKEAMTIFPQESSLKGSLTFKDIRTNTNKVSLLSIGFYSENQEGEYIQKEIEFRNINIISN